jgi:NAD(P)-dependent dehydrogenase (short-subunit alcohol dehydrogenase family)
MINLKGKRILVTGASSGIGKSIAYHIAKLGGSVILLGRNTERLKLIYNSLYGSSHEFYSIDINDYPSLEKIIYNSVEKYGPISGFVHSAGIEKLLPLKSSKLSDFQKIFETNVFAGFEIARLLSNKSIVSNLGASFIFISSINAKIGDSCKVIYSSSKSALIGGTKAIAKELATKKIRCNTVLPGCVNTEMLSNLFSTITLKSKEMVISKHPLGIGEPEDIAYLVCFLLSDNARWITGSEYIIDGGYSA